MRELFVDRGGRLRAGWRLLAQLALYVVLVAAISNLAAVAWPSATGPAPSGGAEPATAALADPALRVPVAVGTLAGTLLSVWIAGRLFDRRPFADFGFHLSRGWLLDLGFGLALGALLMTAIFSVEAALGWVSVTGAFETAGPGAPGVRTTPFALGLLSSVVFFLCVGVYEEALFRGYALRNVAEGLKGAPLLGPRRAVLAAWVLTSALFGVLHLSNPNATAVGAANIALAGLMLGLGYVLTGELAVPIGLHATWNFFQGNVFGFPVSGTEPVGATFLSTEQRGPDLLTGGPFGPEAGLLGLAATLAGGGLIFAWVRLRRPGKAGIHTPIAGGPEQPTPR